MLLATALVVVGVACSLPDHVRRGEAGVTRFHDLFNAGQFREIYVMAHDDFKRVTPQADWQNLLERVRTRLGRVEGTEQRGVNIVEAAGVVTVELSYETAFTGGSATEDFTFVIEPEQAALRGYRIASKALGSVWADPLAVGIEVPDASRAANPAFVAEVPEAQSTGTQSSSWTGPN